MDQRCGSYGAALRNAGVDPGDRVLVQVRKSPEAVALYLACLRIGAVYVPLNVAYTPAEVAFFIEDAKPKLFVFDDGRGTSLGFVAQQRKIPVLLTMGRLAEQASACRPLEHTIPTKEDDLAAILYTSGTTGRSKGAMLTSRNLSSNALVLHEYWGWQDGDVLLHALPIFHVHGLFVALHCALVNASTVLFLPRFDVDTVMAALPEATVMMGVPTFYSRLLDSPGFGARQCEHVRLFVSGSAPLSESIFARFEMQTGHRILERYGMTETGMICSNPLDGERVAGSVGYALPGVHVRIADSAGRELPVGEVGVIEVKGPNVFPGYWGLPERTAEEFRDDGFFITGDLGAMTEDGRVSIVGRARDLIISGGYNIYPREVEQRLDELPEVAESAVIGVPHADLGEAVIAVVVPKQGEAVSEASICTALAGSLARFKHPRRVFFVSMLPRNAMGKVQKNVLRERFVNALSAD